MISSILLAAGQSKRMGGENKLIKKINNAPLIQHSIKNLLNSEVDELIIVLGFQKEIIKKLIHKNNKIKIVFNKNFKRGMASSIKTGLKYLSKETSAFFICLGDMPLIKKNIYNKLIKCRQNNKIVIPTFKGEQGNPVLFDQTIKKEILNIKGDVGAKKIIKKIKMKKIYVKINDSCIKKDFNTLDNFNLE